MINDVITERASSSFYPSSSSRLFHLVGVLLAIATGPWSLVPGVVGGAPSSPLSSLSSSSSSSQLLRYSIEEEAAAGTLVGNIMDDAGLRQRHSPDVISQLRFRFVSEHITQFSIGATSGVIRTAVNIDRDSATVCRQRESCEMPLSVVIQPVEYLRIIRVIIVIVDVNDNAPRFVETTTYLPIIESAAVGNVYVLPTATDVDSPAFGVKRYELDTTPPYGDKRFSVRATRKLDGSTEVTLVLQGKLDRERETQCKLRMVAYDGGTPPKSGQIDIIINVLDSNDNKPEFTSDQYQATINENVPVGMVIVQVQARDKDLGMSGEVTYRFATHTLSSYGQLFSIRNTTGAIYVTGVVDREKSSVYHLVVIAEDRGPDPRPSETTIVVSVIDINDNSPVVMVTTLNAGVPGSGTVGVTEDSPTGTFIAHVTVSDADDGDNGRVNCSLNSDSFALIQKYDTEYQIVTATYLDRERKSRYGLLLRCSDRGATSLTSDTTLNIIVIDVNDNAPTFTSQTYRGAVTENNFIGASVLQVTATDWDEGENARIQYVILPTSTNSTGERSAVSFDVDHRGIVSVLDSVDREKYDHFRFTVLAIDHGFPARTGSALIIITVQDVNDERPQFTLPRYHFNVTENEPTGSHVGSVTAEDSDGEPYNAVTYVLVAPAHASPTTDAFVIDTQTGVITTLRSLDRETQSLHQLVVMARDPIIATMSSTVSVFITVLDRNDNSPVFLYPNPLNDTVHISSATPVGHVIVRVNANDLDAGENRRITYAIRRDEDDNESDPDAEMFTIDAIRGFLRVGISLGAVSYRRFSLTVVAADQGSPPLITATELYIVVNRTIPFSGTLPGGDARFSSPLSLGSPVLFVVLAVAAGCCLVVMTIVVAMVIVRRRERKRREREMERRKNGRMQDLLGVLVKVKGDLEMEREDEEMGGDVEIREGSDDSNGPPQTTVDRTDITPIKNGQNGHGFYASLIRTSTHDNLRLPALDVSRGTRTGSEAEDEQDGGVHSSGGSATTDSGRGASDNGSTEGVGRGRNIPPPPPPTRGRAFRALTLLSYSRQQQQEQHRTRSSSSTSLVVKEAGEGGGGVEGGGGGQEEEDSGGGKTAAPVGKTVVRTLSNGSATTPHRQRPYTVRFYGLNMTPVEELGKTVRGEAAASNDISQANDRQRSDTALEQNVLRKPGCDSSIPLRTEEGSKTMTAKRNKSTEYDGISHFVPGRISSISQDTPALQVAPLSVPLVTQVGSRPRAYYTPSSVCGAGIKDMSTRETTSVGCPEYFTLSGAVPRRHAFVSESVSSSSGGSFRLSGTVVEEEDGDERGDGEWEERGIGGKTGSTPPQPRSDESGRRDDESYYIHLNRLREENYCKAFVSPSSSSSSSTTPATTKIRGADSGSAGANGRGSGGESGVTARKQLRRSKATNNNVVHSLVL